MLSSAFLREVATSSSAPVLVENHCRKTIWYRGSRDGVSPTVPCNLTFLSTGGPGPVRHGPSNTASQISPHTRSTGRINNNNK